MTIASTILTTAHTLGQVRKACRAQCASSSENRDSVGTLTSSEYRFSDRSCIIIEGSKIRIGQWVYNERRAIEPNKRQCVEPECWACNGTGIQTSSGKPCTWNDGIPF